MQQLIAKLKTDSRDAIHAVMGMLDMMTEDPLSRRQKDYLSSCRASADRLLRRVEDICELANVEHCELVRSEFNLNKPVLSVMEIMEVLARRKSLRLECEISPISPMIVGDRSMLENVLLRLLDNAIRFTDQGEIRLSITVQPTDSKRVNIEFLLSDTGPGIPENILSCIANRENDPSGGLGLPIVCKLVRSMGGEISITADPQIGTHVSFALPFDLPAFDANSGSGRDVEDQALDGTASELIVLVAEDCDDSYFLLEAYVKGRGYRLERALDGACAVEMFRASPYDLVVMDINMPVMDGYAATKAMREWETEAGQVRVPIIVLSSESAAAQTREGARVGCSGYITKPVSKTDLLHVLSRYSMVS